MTFMDASHSHSGSLEICLYLSSTIRKLLEPNFISFIVTFKMQQNSKKQIK